MFAIIKTGGKQYIVSPGDKIKVEKLEAPEGGEVVFDNVLLFSDKEVQVGTPYIKDYIVKGKVLKQGKGKKIIVYKYKPKKRYHKKQGHRQLFSEIEILSISKETELVVSEVEPGAKKIVSQREIPPGGTKKTKSATPAKKKVPAAKKTKTSAKKKSIA